MSEDDRFRRVQQWYDFARQDLQGARANYVAEVYNLSCFLAQQAVEKAAKGFLLAKGDTPKREHAISNLLPEEICQSDPGRAQE